MHAIELDSNFADAYIELALTYLYNYNIDMNNWNQNLIKSTQLVDKAILINPNLSKAYVARGILSYLNGKTEEVKENFEKALELNPNEVIAHRDIAVYYTIENSKDLNKSLYHINRAAELDPFSSTINSIKINILLKNKKLNEAVELYEKKSSLFSDQIKIRIQNNFVKNKMEILSLEKKDWTESIKYLEEEIKKDSQNAYIYKELGEAYDKVINDDINFLKYSKKAYELDSTDWKNASPYIFALLDCKKFKEAEKLMNSENYKNLLNDRQEKVNLFNFYYEKEEYDTALNISNDSLLSGTYIFLKAQVLAQKRDIKAVREILNMQMMKNINKAIIFAILEERDSMYYHLDQDKNLVYMIRSFNGLKDFDPYRKEERYKAYLKKNYLPITHWNE